MSNIPEEIKTTLSAMDTAHKKEEEPLEKAPKKSRKKKTETEKKVEKLKKTETQKKIAKPKKKVEKKKQSISVSIGIPFGDKFLVVHDMQDVAFKEICKTFIILRARDKTNTLELRMR